MKVLIDRERLSRRARWAHALSLGGLLTILASVALTLWRAQLQTVSMILLVGGFTCAVIGIYQANRWVKRPRPEDTLQRALKGVGEQYRLYHYLLPADHVLLTPSGIVILETCSLEGAFTYRDGRWRQRITPGRAMRFFVEETFGNPIERAQAEAQAITGLLRPGLPDGARVPVQAMVVFVNPAAEVQADSPPIPVCQPDKLRKRLPQNLPKLEAGVYEQVRSALDSAAGIPALAG
jgi:hypothetical protein